MSSPPPPPPRNNIIAGRHAGPVPEQMRESMCNAARVHVACDKPCGTARVERVGRLTDNAPVVFIRVDDLYRSDFWMMLAIPVADIQAAIADAIPEA